MVTGCVPSDKCEASKPAKRRGRGAGCGIFRDAHARREHAGVETMSGLDGLAADDIGRATRAKGAVEAGGVRPATLDRGTRGQGYECEGHPGRPARRAELADVGRRKPQRHGDDRIVRYRFDLSRQLRNGEGGTTAIIRSRFERATHRADPLLQHDLAPHDAAVAQAEQHRRADRRMAGKRQLAARRKDTNAGAMSGIAGWKDEHSLRVIELVRNGLHGAGIETLGVEHDRERIAGKAAVGEYVKRDETPAHEVSSSSLVAKCDPPSPCNCASTSYPMGDENLAWGHQFVL